MKICSFPGSRRIGPPRDWDKELDGECGDIFVTDAIDTLTGLPVMYSVYRLSKDEIDALAAGGLLRLGIVGMKAHPVFQLGVIGPKTAALVNAKSEGDLGDVIENA